MWKTKIEKKEEEKQQQHRKKKLKSFGIASIRFDGNTKERRTHGTRWLLHTIGYGRAMDRQGIRQVNKCVSALARSLCARES